MRGGKLLVEGLLRLLKTLIFQFFLLLERLPLAFQRHTVMMRLLPAVKRGLLAIVGIFGGRQGFQQRLNQRQLLLGALALRLLLLPLGYLGFARRQPTVFIASVRLRQAKSRERLIKRGSALLLFFA